MRVSEDLVVWQGEPRVKLLDRTLEFTHQLAAVAGQAKQQILRKERSSACRAATQLINDPQIYANPEVLLSTIVYFRVN